MRERELVVSVHGGGRPVAGAEVEFNRREKHRTDAQGAAAYRVFAPNESNSSGVALTVRAPGFAVEAWFGGMPSGSTTQVINLVAEAPLAGRVLNPDGLAVPDAVVALMPIEPWLGPVAVTGGLGPPDDTIARTRTDATGRYTLHGLSPSRTYRVTVESPPAFPSAGLERVVSGGTASADFVLRPAGRVDLDVAAPPGTESYLQRLGGSRNPAALPQIFIEWFDPETGNWQPARVAMQVVRADRESVRLRFDRVAAGTIRIVTEGDGVVAGDVSEAVPVLPGTASVVQVPLAPVHRLRVAVIDVQGRPVLGARVEAFAHTGRSSTYADTGRDGAVTLLVHPAHDVKVTVARSGQVEVTTVIPAGGNPAPIVLPQR
jgi:hypothetical protein